MLIRDATLIHSLRCALSEMPAHPRAFTQPNTLRNTLVAHFLAPSAVHLMVCVSPGSQPPGLSVDAQSTVISASTVCVFGFYFYTTGLWCCQVIFSCFTL